MFDVNHILQVGGILAVALIIFAETGLLVGFFLPGDTLLLAAGIFAGEHKLSIYLLLPAVALAAIVGYQVGYKVGEKAGPKFFKRRDGILFREDYITKSEKFFTKHGGKTLLLIRFAPVGRTVIPLIAGIGKMDKRKFLVYNIVGAIFWTFSVTLAAFWVGGRVPNIDHYIAWLLIVAAVLTSGGVLFGLLKSGEKRQELKTALREELGYLLGTIKSK